MAEDEKMTFTEACRLVKSGKAAYYDFGKGLEPCIIVYATAGGPVRGEGKAHIIPTREKRVVHVEDLRASNSAL